MSNYIQLQEAPNDILKFTLWYLEIAGNYFHSSKREDI